MSSKLNGSRLDYDKVVVEPSYEKLLRRLVYCINITEVTYLCHYNLNYRYNILESR